MKQAFFRYYLYTILLGIIGTLAMMETSCTPDDTEIDPDFRLAFSHDTISFDTVFVTFGSTTFTEFVVYNNSNQDITISSIRLGMGDDSPYRINADGISGSRIENIEVWANDSVHVFVEVTVDPNDQNTPFIVEDSILFETNDIIQDVQLVSWGQNAHFFGPGTPNGITVGVTGDTIWTNDLPYVIFDGVIIDSLKTLTILPGTQIHMHNNAIMLVKGSLNVIGGQDTMSKVVFQGTRREQKYQDVSGQWGAILMQRGSINNTIDNAIIQNGFYGVLVDSLPISGTQPNLILKNSIIRNMSASGILGVASVISCSNVLVYNCKRNAFQGVFGGVYAFNHCTFANFNGTDHQESLVSIGNFVELENGDINVNATSAQFYNTIIHGSVEEEVSLGDITEGEAEFVIDFYNCLIKSEEAINRNGDNIHDCLFTSQNNKDKIFIRETNNFQLSDDSFCKDAGLAPEQILDPLILVETSDILGVPRDENPDMGCFEFVGE